MRYWKCRMRKEILKHDECGCNHRKAVCGSGITADTERHGGLPFPSGGWQKSKGGRETGSRLYQLCMLGQDRRVCG